MDTLPGDEVVLRPSWPIPELGSGRTAYGIPLMMVTGAFLVFSLTRWLAVGMPHTRTELSWILMALAAAGNALVLAFLYDGITLQPAETGWLSGGGSAHRSRCR